MRLYPTSKPLRLLAPAVPTVDTEGTGGPTPSSPSSLTREDADNAPLTPEVLLASLIADYAPGDHVPEPGPPTHYDWASRSNNLRVLRATGATDAQLAHLVIAVQAGRDQPLERVNLDAQLHEPPAQAVQLEELRPAVDRALPPRREGESHEDFLTRELWAKLFEHLPRPPKLPEPSKYKGEDDDTTFMTWLSRLCTWLQGSGLGGPDYEDKEYEAVRYDESKGVEFLASELKRTALRMREPPADITLRQRFMRLLPAGVHNELIDVEESCSHVDRGPRNDAERHPECQNRVAPLGRPRREQRRRVLEEYSKRQNKVGSNLNPAASRSNKTCFGCGLIGHIASDPVCPRYNESASTRPKNNAQIRAQRVVSSYSDDGEEEEELASDEDESAGEDEVDGLWGGDQYDGGRPPRRFPLLIMITMRPTTTTSTSWKKLTPTKLPTWLS
ncbi:hypothetical protein R3P38DRAFT_2802510 [Favolaschia claudopus]|uniref:Zinc knuckle domain-containing protein n=1 Tax=Favolaschia claudopus TaxID=2862362 RepID=A0AAV9ZVN9_9AGAR